MSFSTLNQGTSLVELSDEEMALIGGGEETIVMTCEVKEGQLGECKVTTKED